MNSKIEPYFYILQPTIHFPEPNMQEFYSNKKDLKKDQLHHLQEGDASKENSQVREDKIEDLKNEAVKVTEIIENYQANHQTEPIEQPKRRHRPTFNRVKKFKEMNTLERIDYLYNFPKQLPPVPCVFETDDSSFRGNIIHKTDNLIELKLFNGKTMEIPIETIKEVRMIGLR